MKIFLPGGGDLANFSDDRVNKGGRGEVIDKVEQGEAGLVPPAPKYPGLARAQLHQVIRITQFVVDKAVCLDSRCELIGLATYDNRLVCRLGHQSSLTGAYCGQDTPIGHHSLQIKW